MCDRGRHAPQSEAYRARAIRASQRSCGGPRYAVSARGTTRSPRRLEILLTRTAIAVLVLDACVGEVHVPVVIRQAVLARPEGNLVRFAVGPAVAVLAPAVPLVEESLVIALELVVQDDAIHAATLFADSFLSASVRSIDLSVVRQLARLPEAGVEGLRTVPRALLALVAIGFQKVPAALRQDDGAVVGTQGRSADEPLAFEVSQVRSTMPSCRPPTCTRRAACEFAVVHTELGAKKRRIFGRAVRV